MQTSFSRDRLVAQLSAGLGMLGLILACIGLYGVMAYAISSRTPEIGVMLAAALVAGYLPARRAARLDPIRALRYE